MTIDTVKKYLKVDFPDDDEIIIEMMKAAEEYIVSAAGKYDDSSHRMRLLLLTLVSDMYENRMYTADKQSEKATRLVRNLLLQISLEEDEV